MRLPAINLFSFRKDFRQSRPGKSPAVAEWSCRVFFLVAFSLDSI
jgi:hypothetical protein